MKVMRKPIQMTTVYDAKRCDDYYLEKTIAGDFVYPPGSIILTDCYGKQYVIDEEVFIRDYVILEDDYV